MWRSQQLLRSSVALARAAAGASEQPAGRAVRSFAAKAEAEQYVEVPLPMYGVAGKYASALYVTAVRGNVLDPVETELQQVIGAAEQNPVFSDFLKDPSVSKTVRMKAVEEIFGQTKFNDVTKNFLANHGMLLRASACASRRGAGARDRRVGVEPCGVGGHQERPQGVLEARADLEGGAEGGQEHNWRHCSGHSGQAY
jgi:hypothetical protein